MTYLKGGEPFSLGSADAGILLFHGFTGSPFEVRAFGEALHARGYRVFAPALAGHATCQTDLSRVRPQDYLASAEAAYQAAAAQCKRLYLAGLSMGGALAMHLAASRAVEGVITISAPVFLSRLVASAVPLLHQWMPDACAPVNVPAWQGNVVGYDRATMRSIRAALDVFDHVKHELPDVHAPILIVHSRRDMSVPAANARYIHAHVASEMRVLRILDRGSHLLTLPRYLPLFEDDVYDFLKVLERRQPEHKRSI